MIEPRTGLQARNTAGAMKRALLTPYWLTTNQPDETISVAGLGISDILSFGVSGNATAEAIAFAGDFTNASTDFLVMLMTNDGALDIPLCSNSVHAATIFGTNLNPYRLPESLYIDNERRLKVKLTNLSPLTNDARLAIRATRNAIVTVDPAADLAGLKLREKARLTFPFLYTFDDGKADLNAGQTADFAVTTDAEFDFQLYQISGVASGPYDIDVLDANTGESILNAMGDNHFQISDELVVGTAAFPFRLHQPRLYRAAQKMIVRLTNTHPDANTIYITFGGRKLAKRLWGSVY